MQSIQFYDFWVPVLLITVNSSSHEANNHTTRPSGMLVLNPDAPKTLTSSSCTLHTILSKYIPTLEARNWCEFKYWSNSQIPSFSEAVCKEETLKSSVAIFSNNHHQQLLLRFKPISALPAGLAALAALSLLTLELLYGYTHYRNRKLCLKINGLKTESDTGLIKI